MLGNFRWKLTPGRVMFSVTNIEENRTQKIHTHKKNHTWTHTQFHAHKPTLLTIIQLLPGTTVISYISLLVNHFLSPGPVYSFPSQIWKQFALYIKTIEKAPTFSSTKFFLPKGMILEYIPLSHR